MDIKELLTHRMDEESAEADDYEKLSEETDNRLLSEILMDIARGERTHYYLLKHIVENL